MRAETRRMEPKMHLKESWKCKKYFSLEANLMMKCTPSYDQLGASSCFYCLHPLNSSLHLKAHAVRALSMSICLTSSIFVAQIGEPPEVSKSNQCPCHSKQELQLVCPLSTVQQLGLLSQCIILSRCLKAGFFEKLPWHNMEGLCQNQCYLSKNLPHIYRVNAVKPAQLIKLLSWLFGTIQKI